MPHPVGAELYRVEVGSGPPVAVVHGGPDFDHRYLRPELDRLASAARLAYYDQRGRGRSYRGGMPADIGIASEVDDLDGVRRAMGLDSFVVLGHSWGCLLALEYAIRRPAAVAGLVLMNTAPVSHCGLLTFRDALAASRTATERDELARIAASPAFRAGDLDAELAYYRIHYRPAMRGPADVERVLPRLRAAFTPESVLVARMIEERLYADTWDRETYDLIPRLGQLRVPTLVLHGDHDFVPLAIAERVAESIPGAQFRVVDDSGHFSYLDRPGVVCAAVSGFLPST